MFLIIFIMSVTISIIDGKTFQHDEPLFGDQNLCQINCGTSVHSFCSTNFSLRSDICGDDFFLYDLTTQGSSYRKDIMFGHNGIRNRIAGRMNVADMVKLKWDSDLTSMAEDWVSKCTPHLSDPCTTFFPATISYAMSDSYLYINANSAYVKSNFLPPNLIVSSLRNWYLEKNSMNPPIRIPYKQHQFIKRKYFGSDVVGYFKVHNNFTQMANSDTNRIGCALGRYNHGYHFTCYYYPYMKSDTFLNGKPVSKCPNLYPLPDQNFVNLCTADGSLSIHFPDNNLIYILIILNILLYLIL